MNLPWVYLCSLFFLFVCFLSFIFLLRILKSGWETKDFRILNKKKERKKERKQNKKKRKLNFWDDECINYIICGNHFTIYTILIHPIVHLKHLSFKFVNYIYFKIHYGWKVGWKDGYKVGWKKETKEHSRKRQNYRNRNGSVFAGTWVWSKVVNIKSHGELFLVMKHSSFWLWWWLHNCMYFVNTCRNWINKDK